MNAGKRPAIDPAAMVSRALGERPQLLVHGGDLPATARAAGQILAATGEVFYRGGRLVKIVTTGSSVRVVVLTQHNLTEMIHRHCQPVKLDADGKAKPVTLPERVAKMLINSGELPVPELTGFASVPLLSEDGAIDGAEGFHAASGLYCHLVPAVTVLDCPSRADAGDALTLIRTFFASLAWADGPRITAGGISLADTTMPAGEAESAFLCAFLTAICRPSIGTAPGLIVTAPEISGAGAGKGLTVQAIALVAFGARAPAFTAGDGKGELDKRISSVLMEAGPVLFLDNANGVALKSDLLASVSTENPCRVRPLGESRMAMVNSSVFVAVTGNGLSPGEDLVRRFLICLLDPGCEDPEARDFADGRDGFLQRVIDRRAELLSAALTIWRWGRQAADIERGKLFGNFEMWGRWVRDPLRSLGCSDPVEAVSRAKASDPRRMRLAEIFAAWAEHHHDYPVPAARLHEAVTALIDPQGRGRQFIAASLKRMEGTRAAGFVLSRQESAGRWNGATYQLSKVNP